MNKVDFKRGSDLIEGKDQRMPCEGCAAVAESREAGAREGWQLDPPVCPDCLRWIPTEVPASAVLSGGIEPRPKEGLRIERRHRYWAVYQGETLVCITVYRKGASEVVARLSGTSVNAAERSALPRA